jgi:leucyl aminopeptidase
MKTNLSTSALLQIPADLLAIGVDEEALAEAGGPVDAVDQALGGLLRRTAKEDRFRAKPGQSFSLVTHDRLPARRVALVGLGPRAALAAHHLRALAGRAVRLGNASSAATVAVQAPASLVDGAPDRLVAAVEHLATGAALGAYRFDKYLSEDKRAPVSVTSVDLLVPGKSPLLDAALARGDRLAAAVARARDLVNEPAGVLTPTRLAEIARQLAADHRLDFSVLGPEDCRKLGMGLFLAVAQGSTQEPRFIHLSWRPPTARRRVVLVGKGVTFDSGGLSLKPNDGMLDMKTDMAGAAAVISVMAAIAAEELPIEVHALAACTENMLSGNSYKLGDVLRSKAGKTVEINNTDAEGRLTLADAISYGLDLKPDVIFDFATLTGACMVALGPYIAGVMSNDETLAAEWLASAQAAGEEMWRLPLPDRLIEMLKSEIADMKNTGERWGGALTAGLFLREFVGTVPWVHVDIAGPSTADKENGPTTKGGTGFPVLTIFEYLRRVSRH